MLVGKYPLDQLIDHEHKMCLYGQPPHIIPYQLVTMPDGCERHVDKGIEFGLVDQGSVMTYDLLTKCLKGLVGAMETCDHFLLKVGRLQLSSEKAWLDARGTICFHYLPFTGETCEDDHLLIRRFVQDLQAVSDTACEKSMSLLHGLNIALAESPFDLIAFRDQVRQMMGETL